MRWLLAGLTFTLVVALAVLTASVRAENVRCRKQIEGVLNDASIRSVEHDRLVHSMRQATGREKLAARWLAHLRRNSGAQQ